VSCRNNCFSMVCLTRHQNTVAQQCQEVEPWFQLETFLNLAETRLFKQLCGRLYHPCFLVGNCVLDLCGCVSWRWCTISTVRSLQRGWTGVELEQRSRDASISGQRTYR
jgi:hypothetical protein